jgi:nucleoside 2-deoxyribosyltransferase
MIAMPLVYLAGPITGDTWDGATSWRERATRYLRNKGILSLSPMRAKDFLEQQVREDGEFKIDTTGDPVYTQHPLATAHGITKRDMWDVDRSDLILVNFVGYEKISIGTVLEIGRASAQNKYILIAMEEGNPHRHGMITELASLVVPTLEEAVMLVPAILGISS